MIHRYLLDTGIAQDFQDHRRGVRERADAERRRGHRIGTLYQLPLSIAVLSFALPLEILLGKLILGTLPGSSAPPAGKEGEKTNGENYFR